MRWWIEVSGTAKAAGGAGRHAIRAAGATLANGLDRVGAVLGQSISNLLEPLVIGGHESARGDGVFYDADIHGALALLRIDGTDYSDLSDEAVATVRSAMSVELFTF